MLESYAAEGMAQVVGSGSVVVQFEFPQLDQDDYFRGSVRLLARPTSCLMRPRNNTNS